MDKNYSSQVVPREGELDNNSLRCFLENPIQIDEGIKEVVHLLVGHGFTTMSSCEGGDSHAFKFPTVVIKEGKDVTVDKIAGVLVGAGYTGFTIQHNQYFQDSPIRWRHGQHNYAVEFWRQHGIGKLRPHGY